MKSEARSDLALIDTVTSNLFAGLQELRGELSQAVTSAVVAGETMTRACFGVARMAIGRLDSVAVATIVEAERACGTAVALVRRARREVPGGVAEIATAIAGGVPERKKVAPRPSA